MRRLARDRAKETHLCPACILLEAARRNPDALLAFARWYGERGPGSGKWQFNFALLMGEI